MDLVDAIAANTTARSPVELCLSPLFKREYSALYKGIQEMNRTMKTDSTEAILSVSGLWSTLNVQTATQWMQEALGWEEDKRAKRLGHRGRSSKILPARKTVGKLFKCVGMRHVRNLGVALTTTIMSSAEDDYDKLSKEEREVRDKADREREAAEQAGIYTFSCRRLNAPGYAQ